jgi:mRNA-degrading endonuclease RelE of RelBE toxin-antitoxin system
VKYQVKFQPKAIKAIDKLPTSEKVKIVTKIRPLANSRKSPFLRGI